MASRGGLVGRLGVLALLLTAPAGAQAVSCVGFSGVSVGIDETPGSTSKDANCSDFRCYPPVLGGAAYQVLPAGCNPKTQPCSVRATVPVEFPGHAESPDEWRTYDDSREIETQFS